MAAVKPFRPPLAAVTRALMLVCVAVALVELVGGAGFSERLELQAGLIPARLTGAVAGIPGSLPAPLTLLSAQFIHGGLVHLALNLVFLAWVGRFVEWVVGGWKLLLLYIGGGVAGLLLHTIVDPAKLAPAIGASGSIAAVFGAYAVMFAGSRASGRRVLGVDLSSDAVTALWYAAAWIGLQALTGLVINPAAGPDIAIWAHIGGFITGLLFARPYMRGPQV